MCEFQFPIMNRIMEITDCKTYERAPGYIGEMLNGIFIHYMLTVENRSAKETQLVFFVNTEKINSAKSIISTGFMLLPIKQYGALPTRYSRCTRPDVKRLKSC